MLVTSNFSLSPTFFMFSEGFNLRVVESQLCVVKGLRIQQLCMRSWDKWPPCLVDFIENVSLPCTHVHGIC